MRINLTARHGHLPEGMQAYIEKNVQKLQKYYSGIVDADVVLDWEKRQKTVDFHVMVHGTILKAETKAEHIHQAMDEAIDKIEVQLKRYKDKKRHKDHTKAVEKLTDE